MAKKTELTKPDGEQTTALAVIGDQEYAILKMDPTEIAEVMAQNIGDGEMDAFSLDRVKMPSGGGTSYVLPGLEGDKTVQDITGVIIARQPVRVYWDTPYTGAANPPACSASDAKTGEGQPGGPCRTCPKAAFGSKQNQDGTKGPGQACNECMRLFILMPDSCLPVLITLPPTSLRPARKYFQRLAGRGIPFYTVATQVGLTTAKNAGGITYSEAVFGVSEVLSPEQAAAFKALNATFAPQLSMIDPDRGDYETSPTNDGEQSASDAADAYEAELRAQEEVAAHAASSTAEAEAGLAAEAAAADQDAETGTNASNE